MFSSVAPPLFSYRKFWAHRLGPAPFLPMSSDEMEGLGWDSCDIILVTGDAYVDHPSFGMAVIGRLLEAQGFRVGIIAQPAWQSAAPFTALGRPNLFFGVTAGNMDSMVNRYTADGLPRSDDAYSPGGISNLRPDRASIVYAQRCREAYREVPVVIGGIEASLRRLAHYDYWSDKVRRSILLDCKADLLLYGNAERALVELAHRLSQRTAIGDIKGLRGTAYASTEYPTKLVELDMRDPYNIPASPKDRANTVVRLPDYDQVKSNPALYAHASRQIHLESNPYNARALMQLHGARQVMVTPPPLPLTTSELDQIYELPYQRRPHPGYGEQRIPAYEMIRFSIPIMRGCFGGCTFCSITEHEGRIVQNRSDESILREVEIIRDTTPGFTGTISDLGGPTANMYDLGCGSPRLEAACRRLSCLHPRICPNLKTSHKKLTRLYSLVRETSGVKRVLVASGVRYDLATEDPEYVRALAQHHVGGYLKVAPEHSEPQSLALMMKPAISAYHRFKELFDRYSQQAGKEQYLIPYFIAAHPGTTDMEMVRLAQWLKRQRLRLEQVQTFLPTPMALATTMYHTGFNPLKPIAGQQRSIYTAKGLKQRRLHKAMLRYHDPQNWPLLRGALKRLKHEELIGRGRDTLVPAATKRAGQSQWSTDNSRRKKRR